MKFRSYTDKDYLGLVELLKDSSLYHDYLDKREKLKRKIEQDPESIIVACDSKKIIGSIFLVTDPWMSSLFRLCVRTQDRNRGIGTRLLEMAEHVLRSRGIESVGLYTNPEDKKLKNFYKHRGYSDVGRYESLEKKF